jgi:hypothetical protein
MWLSYNDTYEVSDDGQVRNKKTGLILKQQDSGRYFQITICDNGKKCQTNVHRMVGELFLEPPTEKGLVVDHIGGDSTRYNNNVSNLQWISKSLNRRKGKFQCNNTSGHKYITLTPKGKYRVAFAKNGKRFYSKNFKTLEEAITARDDILNSEEYKT